jgi:hypothetical protein
MAEGKQIPANTPDEKSAKAALAAPAAPQVTRVDHCCVHEYWAIVETNGTLVRGRNVVKSVKLATGQYEIYFTGPINLGVFVATIGRPGIATEPSGQIGVALRCCPVPGSELNKVVWVDTHDSTGAYSDRAFHLLVLTDQ